MLLVLRRAGPEKLAGDAGELAIEGDCVVVLLPVVVGVAASNIIIIAWRRLVPTAGRLGISGKVIGGLMGVTISGMKLKTEVEGIVGMLGWEPNRSPFDAARGLLRCVGRCTFDG